MSMKKVLIVGAGYTGLAAAYDLRKAGFDVEVFESDSEVGGLAGTFEISPGHRIEKFYHHWFSSDSHILGLIRELGLDNRLSFVTTNTGLYFANSIFRLAKPLDLLQFPGIPFIDRVRTGLMALYARRISAWHYLENITATDWVQKIGGKRAFEVIWKPLLQGKFGSETPAVSAVWFWNKLKLRGSSRSNDGSEQLVYFKGGFGAVTDALRQSLEAMGVRFHLSTPVNKVEVQAGKVIGVETAGGFINGDAVLATVPLPTLWEIVPSLPDSYTEKAKQIRFLGNVCLVLRLNRSLSSTYWLNVADPTFPFVGVIEHTNMDAPENYGGERIAFVSKYLPITDEMFSFSEQQLYEYCLPYLKRIFPEFDTSWVIGYRAWRAKYSQPVITLNYGSLIPPEETPIDNLWVSTMAQVYPEDRGTNYAVRHGRNVAKKMVSALQ